MASATPNFLGVIDAFSAGRDLRQKSRLQEMADQGRTLTQQYLQTGNPNYLAQLGGVDTDTALKLKSFEAEQQYRKDNLDLQRSKANEQPNDVQEYEFAKKQGFPGSFMDYQLGLKKAGGTNINIDQRGESEFSKKTGGLQAEYFNKLVEGGQDAQNMIGAITQLRDIGGRITTGKTTEILTALGPYANAVGIKIDGLDDAQAYQAIVARLAPQMRVPGSGATSDFEMQKFLESLPGLGKTPGGNELIQNSLESIAQYRRKAAEIATQAQTGKISRQEAVTQIQSLPDPLTLWKQANAGTAQSGGPPQPGAAAPQQPAPGAGEITIDLDGNILK